MKRLAAGLCTLALAAALVPALSAASGAGAGASVSGSGWRGNVTTPNTPITHFAVSARNGATGVTGTYGSMNAADALLNFRGDVTCLLAAGHRAVVGGVVTSGGEPGQVGTGFAVGFVDNASPTADRITFTDVELAPPVDCVAEAALFVLPTFPVLRGNVEVESAS
jgi:hypothetical protein